MFAAFPRDEWHEESVQKLRDAYDDALAAVRTWDVLRSDETKQRDATEAVMRFMFKCIHTAQPIDVERWTTELMLVLVGIEHSGDPLP
jgi:hypothetical protein